MALPSRCSALAMGLVLWLLQVLTAPVIDFTSSKNLQPMPSRIHRAAQGAGNDGSFWIDPRDVTRELAAATSAHAVLDLLGIFSDYELFNAIHISTAYVRLAKFERSITPRMIESAAWNRLRRKASTLTVQSPLLGEQAVANLLLAMGHLHPKDMRLLDMAPLLPNKVNDFIPARRFMEQEIANIMWALAKLKQTGSQHATAFNRILPGLCSMTAEKAFAFTPQGVSNILFAAGSLIEDAAVVKTMLPSLSRKASECAFQMNPQDLAGACRGLASCGWRDADVFSTLANATVNSAPDWRAHDKLRFLPEILAAFAKVRLAPKALLQLVAQQTERALSTMSDWSLCALCWSFSELDFKSSYLGYRDKVTAEVKLRGLEALVNRSALGPLKWRPVLST